MSNSTGRAKINIQKVLSECKKDEKGFFDRCDASYESIVGSIASRIGGSTRSTRLIMLSGPSSSGKTTTSLKIQHRLQGMNVHAVTISMDDFFKARGDVPVLPDGSKDFESIDALDIGSLKSCLSALIENGAADLPVFDFKAGKPSPNKRHVLLPEDSVAIVEGLHALDSRITEEMPHQRVLKLYVSVSSDFADENGKVVLSARDIRLIRRTIRDNKFRGSRPENTLDMWDGVCRGEDLYVRPFKKYADITVNSIFPCEPCLFRNFATRLFGGIPKDSRHFEKAAQIISGLKRFSEMPMSLVPPTCVLREFTGGSVYYSKKPL